MPRIKDIWITLYFLLFTAVLLIVALVFPSHNWDGIAYAAAAKSFEISDKKELHAFVYEELRSSVPDRAYRDFLQGDYRLTVSQDPESLDQILPFYTIRPAYIFAVYLVSKAGVNLFMATHIVSATAVFCGLWIFFLAVRHRVENYLLIILPFFAIALGVLQVAQLSTPDSLAFLFIAIIIALLLRDHWAVLLVLPVAILGRTDLIIFVLLIAAYLFFARPRWRVWSAVSAILALVMFYVINSYSGNYGYGALFWTAFITNLNYPAGQVYTVTWSNYLRAFSQGLLTILAEKSFLSYLTITLLTVLLFLGSGTRITARSRPRRELLIFALLAFLSVVFHFLLFPAMRPRHYAGQFFLGAVVFLIILNAAVRLSTGQEVE